jgi:hypothetical protein
MAPFPASPAAASMDLIRRPLRDLLRQLVTARYSVR